MNAEARGGTQRVFLLNLFIYGTDSKAMGDRRYAHCSERTERELYIPKNHSSSVFPCVPCLASIALASEGGKH